MSEPIDRATARRVAEALAEQGLMVGSGCEDHDYWFRMTVSAILRALTPAKPPGRTKRGKKGRAE